MRFNTEPVHVPGKEIVIADALSRNPVPYTINDGLSEAVTGYVDGIESNWSVSTNRLELLRSSTVYDSELQQVIGYVVNGWPYMCPDNLQVYHQAEGELSLINGLLVYNGSIVIPSSHRKCIFSETA